MHKYRGGHLGPEKSTAEHRLSPRSLVAMGARCRTEKGARDYVALIDLTPEGCCVLSRSPLLTTGQRVTLQPESLAGFHARVQWHDGCLAGLQFENPLYAPVYEHLARTFPPRAPATAGIPRAGDSCTRLSASYRQEMLRKIAEAEASDHVPKNTEADRYNRMTLNRTRPGLRSQRIDDQVIRLFLGGS
jgi:hypothetical protein